MKIGENLILEEIVKKKTDTGGFLKNTVPVFDLDH
jgi:hypothetical protein